MKSEEQLSAIFIEAEIRCELTCREAKEIGRKIIFDKHDRIGYAVTAQTIKNKQTIKFNVFEP